eukprot:TRINITY_DN3901_c0_g1_i1.p1 TRINITY_DN3901_c0_g1~~TRINITY_DN3901_c0_g1_i1.p1  ORF type:complete len:328 (+),score=35.38 TRINITY_DN3901_c0_g1_i1:75-1058(+)
MERSSRGGRKRRRFRGSDSPERNRRRSSTPRRRRWGERGTHTVERSPSPKRSGGREDDRSDPPSDHRKRRRCARESRSRSSSSAAVTRLHRFERDRVAPPMKESAAPPAAAPPTARRPAPLARRVAPLPCVPTQPPVRHPPLPSGPPPVRHPPLPSGPPPVGYPPVPPRRVAPSPRMPGVAVPPRPEDVPPTEPAVLAPVQFLGFAEWTQCNGQSSELQDLSMHRSCQRAFAGSARACFWREYESRLVLGLPGTNTAEHSLCFAGLGSAGNAGPLSKKAVEPGGALDGTAPNPFATLGVRTAVAVTDRIVAVKQAAPAPATAPRPDC